VVGLALLEAQDVCCNPKTRDGGKPRTGYRTERGKEEVVYSARNKVDQRERKSGESDVVGYPRKRDGERSGSDEVHGGCSKWEIQQRQQKKAYVIGGHSSDRGGKKREEAYEEFRT
jgi:hypothetical protein